MNTKTLKIDKLPTIRRLPTYLRVLRDISREGREYVSSGTLADLIGIEPILVRKDLELPGISGIPRVGFFVPDLIKSIEGFLGWGNTTDAFLFGVGQLGTALLGYGELANYGLKIIAGFDNDPEKVDRTVHGVKVLNIDKAPGLLGRLNVRLAILTVPPDHAQKVTDLLVENGIQGVWNYTPVALVVPEGVTTQKEDLLSGLAVLSAKMSRNGA
jgi:redox-sensing transcriptional repressor